jgi:hypothetical protein
MTDPADVTKLDLPYVDATGYGDGYQAFFEKEPDRGAGYTGDYKNAAPYFLIQRHLDPDDGKCYVEVKEEERCGHYKAVTASLNTERSYVELLGPKRSLRRFEIRFRANRKICKELIRGMSIVIGKDRLKVERESDD